MDSLLARLRSIRTSESANSISCVNNQRNRESSYCGLVPKIGDEQAHLQTKRQDILDLDPKYAL